jgi:uncharacterized membrane protein YhiD involved in acid resistance
VTAALGIACGLPAWQIVALSMALAVFLLVGVALIESVFDNSDEGGYN